ncbi:MAG: MFS transporter [Candidatus Micrarchaeota archaeon]
MLKRLEQLSKNTIAFGITSFLVDVSSEMITPIMPLFLLNVLKANALIIGFIEGLSEFIVSIFGAISGYLSDRIGKRKKITTIGYLISSLIKGLFAFATNWQQILYMKGLERVGKGIREVPRDALILYSEKKTDLGKAFGFRKMMDNAGAIIGAILATSLMVYLLQQFNEESAYRIIFLIAVIPALIGTVIIALFVKDVGDKNNKKNIISGIFENKTYTHMLVLGMLFALAQFGIAFFILRAHEITNSALFALFGYLVYTITYTISALPAGVLTDRFGGKKILMLTYALFALTNIGLAFANDLLFIMSFGVFGIVMAILETTPRAFIAKIVNKHNYGTAIGIYHGAIGIFILPANIIAGLLWDVDVAGIHAAFIFSFIFSLLAVLFMVILINEERAR